MPDLTQARYNQLFRRWGAICSMDLEWREIRDRHLLNRSRLRLENEVNGVLSRIRLDGVHIGQNTDEDGIIYLRIFDETPGAGQARIRGYESAADRTANANHVFNAEGADGATLTVTEATASGITGGQIVIGTVTANDSNPQLRVHQDWPLFFKNVFGALASDRLDEDAAVKAKVDAAVAKIAVLAEQASTEIGALHDAIMNQMIKLHIQSTQTAIARDSTTVDSSGAVTLGQSGILADLVDEMQDNTPGPQDVLRYLRTASAITFDADNNGLGSASAVTLLSSSFYGRVQFELSKTLDEQGPEEFDVTLFLTDGSGRTKKGKRKLTIGQVYRDHALGIGGFTLSRTYTKSGDGGNTDFAAVAAITNISGETSVNTLNGQIGLEIVANGANWDIYFHNVTNTALMNSTTRRSGRVNVATGAVFTATALNGGFNITWQVGSGPAAGLKAYILDINQFEFVEANGIRRADAFEFTITLSGTEKGRFADVTGKRFAFAPNTETLAGVPTIDDSYATCNNEFFTLQHPDD